MSNPIPTAIISEYNLGDLFKAPEPIIEAPPVDLDPITSAISMISCGDHEVESIQTEELLNEVFYGCSNDLMENSNIETAFSEILDIKIPVLNTDGIQIEDSRFLFDASLPGSVSSGCLSSMDWIHGPSVAPSFLDFSGLDLGNVYGMRRAYSEGDMKIFADGNTNTVQSPGDRPLAVAGSCIADQRREQLSRYRNKKTKRNFGRKIKYACRKALADSQPRIRGRFAKTEECGITRRQSA